MKSYQVSIISMLILLVLFSSSFSIALNRNYDEFCLDEECILSLIKETNRTSLCNNSFNRDFCYYKAAFEVRDPSVCLETKNSSLCIFEYSLTNNDSNYCNLAPNASFCFYSYAITQNDSSICALSNEYEKSCYKKLNK